MSRPRSNSEAVAHTKRGFNLIEAAIVLGVVGFIIGGIWVAASAVSENLKISKTVSDIALMVKNVQGLISNADSQVMGNAVSFTPTVISAGAAPADWVKGSNLQSPFGGNAKLVNYNTGSGTRFDVALYTIPVKACVQLVSKISAMGTMAGSSGNGSIRRSTLGYISINGAAWVTTTFPVTPASAATGCNQTGNLIRFTFGYTRNN